MFREILPFSLGRKTKPLLTLGVAAGIACPAFAHAEGMPQLELGNWLVQAQVFWGAGIFVLFMLALKYSVMPRIDKMLSEREVRIENDLAYARQAQKEAENLKAEVEAGIRDSRRKIQKNMQEMADLRRQKLKSQETELRQKMQEKMHMAVGEMESSVQAVRQELGNVVLPVAEFIVDRCLHGGDGNFTAYHTPDRSEMRQKLLREQVQKHFA